MIEPLEKQLENSYKIFKNDHERLRENMMDSIHEQQVEYEPEPEQTFVPKRKSSGPSLGEIIMDNRIFKIAAGIIIVGIIAIALKIFTGTNTVTSIAFGDVLNKIQNSSYTFDITTIDKGKTMGTGKGMMLQPGIVRFDTNGNQGGTTTISNFHTGESIIIFHNTKTVINMKKYLEAEGMPDMGPFTMLLNPIENLWNLKNENETSLGEEEIDNQPAIGFKVEKKNKDYSSDIIVWANKETNVPMRVEIFFSNNEDISESQMIVMSNFDLDVDIDEELFNMEPPEGYTMAYQQTLEEREQLTESTPEAQKIEQSIELWSNSQKDKAIETILNVDWSQPFKFSGDMYLFYMKEIEIVLLKQDDQEKVKLEIKDMSFLIRKFCFMLYEEAQTAIAKDEYEKAEKYIKAALEIGKLINRDNELTYTAQTFCHALIIKSLGELEKLYKESGNQEKLQQTQQDLEEIITESESYRKYMNDTFGS